MFKTLKNAWKTPELQKKLLFTLFIVLLYRLGACIIVPYVSGDIANSFQSVYGLGAPSVSSHDVTNEETENSKPIIQRILFFIL